MYFMFNKVERACEGFEDEYEDEVKKWLIT